MVGHIPQDFNFYLENRGKLKLMPFPSILEASPPVRIESNRTADFIQVLGRASTVGGTYNIQ